MRPQDHGASPGGLLECVRGPGPQEWTAARHEVYGLGHESLILQQLKSDDVRIAD